MPRKNNDMERVNVFLPKALMKMYRTLGKKTSRAYADFLREDLVVGANERVKRLKKTIPPDTMRDDIE